MAKKSRTQDTAADFARRSNAISRMRRPPREERPALVGKDFSPRPMPRPSRGPEESMRPVMRPDDTMDRMQQQRMRDTIEMGNRQDPGMIRRDEERGFAKGGKVDGFPDLNKDGKVTKADVLKGRGVEGFAEGGMVRGCKAAQMTGKKFSGTF